MKRRATVTLPAYSAWAEGGGEPCVPLVICSLGKRSCDDWSGCIVNAADYVITGWVMYRWTHARRKAEMKTGMLV